MIWQKFTPQILRRCYLPVDCIDDFKDKVGWGEISQHQTLSERFIEQFKDRIQRSKDPLPFWRRSPTTKPIP
jgi:hypothetical protein